MTKTPAQVARETGKSLGAIYRALIRGAIPGARVGRTWLIPNDYYERMLATAAAEHKRIAQSSFQQPKGDAPPSGAPR